MKAVEQKIWRGGQLNKDIKKDFKLKKIEQLSFKWLTKDRFAIKDIFAIIVLVLAIKYLSGHLIINWK